MISYGSASASSASSSSSRRSCWLPGLLVGVVDVLRGLAAGDFTVVLRLIQPVLAFLIQAGAGLYFVFSGGAAVNLLAKWPTTKVAGQ